MTTWEFCSTYKIGFWSYEALYYSNLWVYLHAISVISIYNPKAGIHVRKLTTSYNILQLQGASLWFSPENFLWNCYYCGLCSWYLVRPMFVVSVGHLAHSPISSNFTQVLGHTKRHRAEIWTMNGSAGKTFTNLAEISSSTVQPHEIPISYGAPVMGLPPVIHLCRSDFPVKKPAGSSRLASGTSGTPAGNDWCYRYLRNSDQNGDSSH